MLLRIVIDTSQAQTLVLPTDNKYLITKDYERFYMYVFRSFEGEESKPWSAGTYGFVRTLRRTEDGIIGTRFHEGIDIAPLERDSHGNPSDWVKAISLGKVVYVNNQASGSNYGKYIVIEHTWHCGKVYSLYAHLASISVHVGDTLQAGEHIGVMGYTGKGINKTRAHLHLELCLLLSRDFDAWHYQHFHSHSTHGIYNGLNLSGLDYAAFYLEKQAKPKLTLPAFIARIPAYYKVTIPRHERLEILNRYPWLGRGRIEENSPSWEIAFSASGLPLSIVPSFREVKSPIITSVRACQSKQLYLTKGLLEGTGQHASLSDTGRRFIELFTLSSKDENTF